MPLEKTAEPWLVLSLCPEVGHATALKLINHCGSAADVLSASRSDLLALGLSDTAADFLRNPDEQRLQPTIGAWVSLLASVVMLALTLIGIWRRVGAWRRHRSSRGEGCCSG